METIEAIKSKYGKLSEGELLAVIARLLSENGYLKSLLYTGRSERRREEPTGIKPLFDEVEDEAGAPGSEPSEDDDALPVEESSEGDKPRKRRGKRKPLPDHLPRIRKMIDLSDEEKVCQQHKVELEKIGEEVVEKLEVEPARAYVTQIVTVKYKCPCCGAPSEAGAHPAGESPVVTKVRNHVAERGIRSNSKY